MQGSNAGMRLLVIAGVLVTLLLLVPLGNLGVLPRYPALRAELQNFAHPVVFAALALLGRQAMPRSLRRIRGSHDLVLAGTLVLFAAFTEILQGFFGREESLADFVGDLLGICVGLLWPPCNRLAIYTATMATALACLPLLWTLSAYSYRQMQMPQIWRADSLLLKRFSRWQAGSYPGLVLEGVPPDWRAYRSLALTVHNPGAAAASFTVRIHDAHHDQRHEDRFNQTFHLAAGATDVFQIPLSDVVGGPTDRTLDLAAVAGIVVFQNGSEAGVRVAPVQMHLVP